MSASWLTSRDRDIANNLFEHSVLTTSQLQSLHFSDERRCQKRLAELYERCVIDRFRPLLQVGSAPYHYVLGELGAHIVAADRSIEPDKLRHRLRADLVLASSRRLTHLIEVNDFFSTLVRAARDSGAAGVTNWWSERRCRQQWDGVVRPDGLGRIEGPEGSCTFFLELDRGTERGTRLADKLASYEWFGRLGEEPRAVVFLFPSATRETAARKSLTAGPDPVVASSSKQLFYADPLGSVWLPLGREHRMPLWRLPHGSGDGLFL